MPKTATICHDISNAIDAYISQFGYGIVRDLVGHGIGTSPARRSPDSQLCTEEKGTQAAGRYDTGNRAHDQHRQTRCRMAG